MAGKKREWRRFIPIGTEKEMERLDALMERKNLSGEDLITIFRAIMAHPRNFWLTINPKDL